MPTPISHAAVGFAIAAWTAPEVPTPRVCTVAAACAALPDIDALGWPLHIGDPSFLAHRAITHSLLFAVVGAVVATGIFFRDHRWSGKRSRLLLVLGLALLSHVCLDALSTYSVGVEFLAPLSQHRFRFPWTPLGDPTRSLVDQLVQEAGIVLLPAIFIGWLGFKVRRSTLISS